MTKDAMSGDLAIARQGYRYVGGKYEKRADGQHVMVGQSAVDYQIPAKLTHPYPLVLLHGAGHNGSVFEGTPDGKDSWAHYFLRRGYAVYILEQPGVGRTIHDAAADKALPVRNADAVAKRNTNCAPSDLYPQARHHTQWPGAAVPGDPIFDRYYATQVAAIGNQALRESLGRDATVALLDEIGPAILVVLSKAAPIGWLAADARPHLVKGIVSVEPQSAAGDINVVGRPEYFRNAKITRPWGLTAIPITYQPAAKAAGDIEFVLQDQPDAPELGRYWLQKEPARKLPNLGGIPIAALTAEASPHTGYDHGVVAYLRQAGVTTEHIYLADQGVRGNGPTMTLEKNTQEIAAVIDRWLEKNVSPENPNAPVTDGITLSRQGQIFIGGTYRPGEDGKRYMVGKAYVRYQIPRDRRHPFPVVMIHGDGHCGTLFNGTPDGREGWAWHFLKRGYAVYLLDRPGIGRSGFDPELYLPIQRSSAEQVAAKTGGTIGDPAFDRLYARLLPEVANRKLAHRYAETAIAALLDEIGPAILLTHGDAGVIASAVAEARPALVKAILAVEPTDVIRKSAEIPVSVFTEDGSGPMMMFAKNNRETADLMADWLAKALPS
jgi:pimeloyl-ACP methyl ester carboxylesterase